MMKTYKCQVEFKTSHVLTQKASELFWQRGDRFHASGAQQYEWQAHVDAENIQAATQHVYEAVAWVTEQSGLSYPPDFIGITVDLVPVVSDVAAL